ncbi:MAG: hypothetical protein R2795_05590 [Saprospiraceae bacterium]
MEGTYSLTDTPAFDDDITILDGGVTFLSSNPPLGNGYTFFGDPGTISLAGNRGILPGQHMVSRLMSIVGFGQRLLLVITFTHHVEANQVVLLASLDKGCTIKQILI